MREGQMGHLLFPPLSDDGGGGGGGGEGGGGLGDKSAGGEACELADAELLLAPPP